MMQEQRRLTVYTLMRNKRQRAGEALQQALAQARRMVDERSQAHEQAVQACDQARSRVTASEARIQSLKEMQHFPVDRMVGLQRYRDDCVEGHAAAEKTRARAEQALKAARQHFEDARREAARNQVRVDAYDQRIHTLRKAGDERDERVQEEQAEESALGRRRFMSSPRSH